MWQKSKQLEYILGINITKNKADQYFIDVTFTQRSAEYKKQIRSYIACKDHWAAKLIGGGQAILLPYTLGQNQWSNSSQNEVEDVWS